MTPLAELLTQETEQVARFIKVLEREQQALKNNHPEELGEINGEKKTLVESLNQLESRRLIIISAPVGATQQASIQAWFKKYPQERTAAALWKKLLDLAKRARELHDFNGTLVAMLLQRTNDTLSILNQHAQDQSLYGSDGQASVLTGSRIVDSA